MQQGIKIICLFSLSLIMGCKSDVNKSPETIRFTNSNQDFVTNQIYQEYSYNLISLETCEESRFYRADCSFINESNIVIYDEKSNKLLLFDKMGNFNLNFFHVYIIL